MVVTHKLAHLAGELSAMAFQPAPYFLLQIFGQSALGVEEAMGRDVLPVAGGWQHLVPKQLNAEALVDLG
jgi:hypothetical protein